MPTVTGNVADPHWYWWIVFYFFFGGIAAGAFLMAAVSDLFADRANRPVVWVGYLLAMPLVGLCGILLILDLGAPERFWHMLWNITTNRPSFKYWSPMSYGSWVLTGFGLFSGLAFIFALAETRNISFLSLNRLATGIAGKIVAAVGGIFAILFGSYTGALLNATNQRVWGDNTILGAVFIASAVSTGIAAIILALSLRRRGDGLALQRLERTDIIAIAVEVLLLFALISLLAGVGRAAPLLTGVLGFIFWGVTLVIGLLIPLGLYLRPRLLGVVAPLVASVLVLVGGLALRYVVIMSSQV